NANKRHFDLAVKHFKDFQERWPGLLNRMITRRVLMEDFSSAIRKEEGDIKVVMEVSR
ncbi:MAG: theronine dehydrogenase, partial [Nitrospirae bacterium]|nr:theronine dehydrogenase [Nitrospirota bacterium]